MRRLWKRRSRDPKVEHFSILDLGASAVKALVIERAKGQVSILGHASAPHRNGIAPDGTIGDLSALGAACEQALAHAEDDTEAICGSKVVPDVVLIGVPLAWMRGAMGVGRVQRARLEDSITPQECVEPVVRSGQDAVHGLERLALTGKWELLGATVMAFSVDGHRVTDPVGFRGHVLEARSFVVTAPSLLLDVSRLIADRLQLDQAYLVAEPLALAAAAPGDGLIIQVGAQTTGMILERYGAPLAFTSVNHGGLAFAQALADAFHVSLSRADALLRAYARGRLNDDGRRSVSKALGGALVTWLSAVTESLRSWNHLSQDWPSDIYLCGGASALTDVQALVSTVRWPELLPFSRMPRIRTWDGSGVTQVTDRTGSVWHLSNVTVLSLAAWMLPDHSSSVADRALGSALKIRERL